MTQVLDVSTTEAKISAMRKLGVPYPEGFESIANDSLTRQAEGIALDLQKNGVAIEPDKDIIALIAYIQRLGTDIKGNIPVPQDSTLKQK